MKTKSAWIKYGICGLALVALVSVCVVFWPKSELRPVVTVRVLQTRSALATAELQKLLDQLPGAKGSIQFEVFFREADAEAFPEFDWLIGDDATVNSLRERKSWKDPAVPLYEEGYQVLFYNKKLSQSVPKTWDELLGQTVVSSEQTLNRFGLGLASDAAAVFPFVSRAFLDEQGKLRSAVDSGLLKAGIDTLKALRYTYSIVPRECPTECAVQMFLQEKAPFAMAAERRWKELEQKFGADLGIAPLPGFENGASYSARTTVYMAASRSKDAARQETLQKFLVLLQGNHGASLIFSQLGKLPSFYLKTTANELRAQELALVVKQSTVPMSEGAYDQLLDGLRLPIQQYYQGLIASTETIELIGKLAP